MIVALRSLSFFLLGLLLLNASSVLAQADLSTKLEQELNTTRQVLPVYVMLKSQANAKTILATEAGRGLSKKEQVAQALTQVKLRNQQSQKSFVERLNTFEGVSNVRSRWIVNMVGFDASPEKIREIASYPEVAAIYYDEPWEIEKVLDEVAAVSAPGGKEPGLAAVNADKMWALGYTGFGGVAFTADTGVDPFHPAINHKYAGYDGRAGSWYDFDQRVTFPFDCGDHGTHVTGTILGVDRVTEDTIGVAYNAHWLGGAILCGIGTADNIGAFEWAIDPDGDFATDDDRPVVINNSWRDPSIAGEECTTTNPYPTILDNLEAAGIAVVFSAGNSGPDASTITPPHNYNSGLVNAFTVGALNSNSTGIAGFSSRGPALCSRDSVPLDIKPEVSAPGSSVRSCLPGVEYGLKSGTSMAAPHVAGAILLLKEAFPLLNGEALKLALYNSAVDMGTAGEDNTFGRGIIDVFAAYNYLIGEGNTPTAPSWPTTAPVVKGMQVPNLDCNGEFSFELTIANEGVDDISTVSYEYAINSVVSSGVLDNVDLSPGQTETFTIAGTSTLSGSYVLQFRLIEANGNAVDPRLDIGGAAEVVLSQIAPAELVMDDFGTNGPCLNSPIILSLNGTTGDSIVSYFNASAATGVGAINSPQPFVIEELTAPTTLYAVAEYLVIDGLETPELDDIEFAETDDITMQITANENVRLRQANVIAEGSGRILIEVINENTGGRAARRSAQVVEGVNAVEIRASLEQGVPYSINITGNVELGEIPNERISGTDFADGRVSITFSPNSFFLYDIESGYVDGCESIEIDLSPDPTRTSATLAPVAIPAQVEQGAEVVFSETSLASATDHRWIVNGTTYTGSGDMLRLQATTLGIMSARVLANDDNDCLATGTTEAEVVQASLSTGDLDGSSKLDVYPNPASDYFELNGTVPNLLDVSLIDATGRMLQLWSGGQKRYNLQAVPKGAYLLQLVNKEGQTQTVPLVIE
ncbi:MAG: S8 family serine peptidase [Saprospiraceae bacterium]